MKISVIGTGNVGSVAAFILARRGFGDELVLCGRDTERSRMKAEGEALDIAHAVAFTRHRLRIRGGVMADTADSDILVFAASAPTPETMTDRMQLAHDNTKLVADTIPRLAKLSPSAILVNVTNPLDVVNYHMLQLSGFDWRRVIGTGTLIDSARFRAKLSQTLDINANDIKAYVIGEHGESQFAAVERATVGGESLKRLLVDNDIDLAKLADFEADARRVGFDIFEKRGYTNYAVAMGVEMIVENIVNDVCATLPVSVKIDKFAGVKDVCLSIPCVVGRTGVRMRLAPELSDSEREQFQRSAERVRQMIDETRLEE